MDASARSETRWPTGNGSDSIVSVYEERVAAGFFRGSKAQVACLERLDVLRAEFLATAGIRVPQHYRRGVYIYGDPGGGKTMMMDIFHEVATKQGIRSRRAHFHDFMQDMNMELHRVRKEHGSLADPLKLVAKHFLEQSPLLCFDECHVLNVGDAMIMRRFFEHLFALGGTVVATSNLAPEKLYSSGINREVFQPFIDSIMNHCDPVCVTPGEDFRETKSRERAAAQGDRAFFWPLGPEAEAQLIDLVTRIRGCFEEPVSTDIAVPMGRVLRCRRAWLGGTRVAEFSFEELCVAAVGTSDYMALCDGFDVVAVTGVPRFRETDEDSARRFAHFVDILYDKQKRLLCTVDAPPREIFAAIRAQYSNGIEDQALPEEKSAICVPTHGGSSGRHVSAFRLPNAGALQYSESGGYSIADGSEGEAQLSAQQPPPEERWVEWSATGLKDASMFDLTCHTKTQQHDRMLPLIRCESRLAELAWGG